MATKSRPAMFDKPARTPLPAAPNVVTLAPPVPSRRKREGFQQTSLYLPVEVHERLREMAFVERVKFHDLVCEAIDGLLAERGHSERIRKHGA